MKKNLIMLGLALFLSVSGSTYAQSSEELTQALDNFAMQIDQIIQEENQLPTTETSLENLVDQTESVRVAQPETLQQSGLDSINHYINKFNINHCEVNGQQVPCEELLAQTADMVRSLPFIGTLEQHFGSLVSVMLWVLAISAVVAFIGFIFWIVMLIDAIKHQKDNKAVWILVIVFGSVLGALIYFFVEKIERNKKK
ncbi:MAG: hypothetical protein DLD55_01890 [candidate division SR1 bacterium]|nr:MAG: hypothetical protein DLD55_01890 [candidate division SR1 bacterium]